MSSPRLSIPSSPRTDSRGTVLASIFRTVLDAAAAAGLPQDELLRLSGVTSEALEDLEGRVPQPSYMRLWEEIEERVKDPFFGLRFSAAQVDAATFSVVGFAARSSETMGEALQRVARYSRILNDAEEITLTRDGESWLVGQNPRGAGRPWPRHKAEGALANYVLLGRAWTGATWSPIEVCFRHARPSDTSEHRRVFGCPVHFDRPRNELRLDPSVLALALRGASPDLGAYLSQRADRMLATVTEATLLDDVRRAVREALPGGPPDLAAVGRRLGLSARSLQRRLAEEETTFAKLVDEERRRLSLDLLADRRITVEEAGFLVGFADARGFRRAFERWTGCSPRAYRADPAARAGLVAH